MTSVLVGQGRNLTQQILEEFNRLPIPERLTIIESMLQGVREDLRRMAQATSRAERRSQLAKAAEILLPDYMEDAELTAFTALDGEDFYAEG
ncbi:MAG: hypothetical protein H5T61_08465 [Thermoflexales bacterium]|nr:hypothetical protein [Thermoflexales bacterium]